MGLAGVRPCDTPGQEGFADGLIEGPLRVYFPSTAIKKPPALLMGVFRDRDGGALLFR